MKKRTFQIDEVYRKCFRQRIERWNSSTDRWEHHKRKCGLSKYNSGSAVSSLQWQPK